MGLAILTRETAVPLFAAVLFFAMFSGIRRGHRPLDLAVIFLVAVMIVAPWSVRNYFRLAHFVPVASISGHILLQGNNECIASESLLTPFWGEGSCRSTDQKRESLLAQAGLGESVDNTLRDRIEGSVARQFIRTDPIGYLRLSLRRMWTLLLPFNPRADQRVHQRIAFLLYWMAVVPVGLMSLCTRLRGSRFPARLLGLLIIVQLLLLVFIYFTPDGRHRIGVDLLLGCFASVTYAELLRRSPLD